MGEAISVYDNPELQTRVVELRDVEKKQWKDVCYVIQDEFNLNKEPMIPTLSKVYNKAVATTITVEKKANKHFEDFSQELNVMYKKTVKVLARLVEALEKVYEEFEASDMEDMQKYLMFIKLAPQIKATTEQILSMVKHHEERQDKIKIEQKNLIYSTSQINEQINNVLKMLIDEGYVRVLKKLPFK